MNRALSVALLLALVGIVAIAVYWMDSAGDDGSLDDPADTSAETTDDGSDPESRVRRTGDTEASGQRTAPPPEDDPAVFAARVVDPARAPVEGARVVVGVPGAELVWEAISDAEGNVEVATPALSGARLTVTRKGFAPLTRDDLSIEDGQRLELGDLALSRGGEITGLVRSTAGKTVGGAQVYLIPHTATRSFADIDIFALIREMFGDDKAVAQTISGPDGTFAFSDIAAGDYLAAVYANGWEAKYSDPAHVKPGDAPARLTVTLEPGATLHGRVEDSNGSPVADVTVGAVQEPEGFPFVLKAIKTRTDENGTFRFETLGQRKYMLFARKKGYATAMDDGKPREKPYTLTLEQGAVIRGNVVNAASGDGIGGVTLSAISNDGPMFAEARSKADGSFVLENVSPTKRLTLMAKKDGLSIVQEENADVEFFGGMRIPYPIESGGDYTVEVRMSGGSVVRGKVIDAETNEGLVGAEVRWAAGGMMGGGGLGKAVTTRTTAGGAFELTGVPAGPLLLFARLRGYEMRLKSAFAMFGGRQKDLPKIAPGEIIEDHTIELHKGKPLRGIVKDSGGTPVAGATVTWMDEMSMFLFGMPSEEYGTITRTGEDGRFLFPAASSSENMYVAAQHRDYPAGGGVEVRKKQRDAEVEVTINRGATLRGTARLASGAPAVNIKFRFDPENGVRGVADMFAGQGDRFAAVTDASGSFLITGIPPGKGDLEIETSGWSLEGSDEITLDDGREKTVTIQLLRMVSITGVITYEGGKPAHGARVSASRTNGKRGGWSARAGRDGRYVIEVPEGDSYDIRARHYIRKGRGDQQPPENWRSDPERNIGAGATNVDLVLKLVPRRGD